MMKQYKIGDILTYKNLVGYSPHNYLEYSVGNIEILRKFLEEFECEIYLNTCPSINEVVGIVITYTFKTADINIIHNVKINDWVDKYVNHPPSKERWACRKTLTRTNYGLNGRIA